ncbi:MAG TPA: ketoacyl-ACP synthase III [Candidatus Margulisiibacteriota bacterium]|nr:ketoacyl-ACP synthase III [Candidatus Margulisiibacteriota bacterium]
MRATILGLGHHLPPEVDTVGVRRPIAVDPVGPSTLAVPAANQALAQAGLSVEAVDFIVFATMTPDVTFPGAGCFFQDQMGCATVGALDIRAQCAGFLFGLVIADQFVKAGVYAHILVIGAEVHSAGLDYSERGARLAALYGDGAGVAVIGRGDGNRGLRGAAIHTDGRHHDRFWCEYPASRQHPVRMTPENFREGRHFITMDIDAVRTFGEQSLPAVIAEALQAAEMSPEQIDRFIISHVLVDVAETVAKGLNVASSRLNIPGARHGHLTAAALPTALSEEVVAGTLGGGDTVCLAAAGAGFAWGAAVLTL